MKTTFLSKVLASSPDSLTKEFVFDFLHKEVVSPTELHLTKLVEYCFILSGHLNTLSPLDYMPDDWAKIQKIKVMLHRVRSEAKQGYEYLK